MTLKFRVPMKGRDAYTFEIDLAHRIGMGGFSHVFRATRNHDQQDFAIKRSKDPLTLLDKKEQ
jgi:hypothetical protein